MKLIRMILTAVITIIIIVIISSCTPLTNPITQSTPTQLDEVIDRDQTEMLDIEELHFDVAKVTRHVDGDTFYATINDKEYKVRLIGVNCPESTNKVDPFGKEASEYTEQRLLGKTIYLERDAGDTDRYGRLLRYVWLSEPQKITEESIESYMFNAMLVGNGYAQVMTIQPNVKYQQSFVTLQKEAMESNKGLWRINKIQTDESQLASSSYKFIGNSNTHKFHKANCKYVKDMNSKYIVDFDSCSAAIE